MSLQEICASKSYAEEKIIEEDYLKEFKKLKYTTLRLGTITGISKE